MEDEKTANISVTVDANPVATVAWFFNGAPIDGTGEKLKLEYESRSLTIGPATMDDAGPYTIVADNGIGRVETTVTLDVTPKTYPVEVGSFSSHVKYF